MLMSEFDPAPWIEIRRVTDGLVSLTGSVCQLLRIVRLNHGLAYLEVDHEGRIIQIPELNVEYVVIETPPHAA
ncbi:MAG: hypothetical protein AAGE98_18650 [Actinomycetota bacterium]